METTTALFPAIRLSQTLITIRKEMFAILIRNDLDIAYAFDSPASTDFLLLE